MASCSRHDAAVGYLPYRCSLKVLEKTGIETMSAFNSACFLKLLCRYIWLYQLSTCAKKHQQNEQRTEADKMPTGNTGQMLTIEKIARHCN